MTPLRVGIVGCGNISGIYFANLTKFGGTQVVACSDLDPARAKDASKKYKGVKVLPVEELIASDTVDLVLNLTIPHAHAEVALKAVEAGKHVYNEKPLTIRRRDARKLLQLAEEKTVLVGCAPDTFLGGGLQTCRELIDSGAIGTPVGAHAFMLCHGHESWHPSPEFYYEKGGGPMFDMGPYYLTALVHLLGPVRRVTGSTRITEAKRTITSAPKQGKAIQVEVPTHIAGIMDFESGAIGEITTSFDVRHSKLPSISIYGSEGSMLVPDPNGFGGEVFIRGKADDDWKLVPLTRGFAANSRGVGVLDMAGAIAEGRPARASGELAYHVLDLMHSFHDASDQGKHIELESTAAQPAALRPSELVDA